MNNLTNSLTSWQFWALLSSVSTVLSAILAKVEVEPVNSDFETLSGP